MIEIHQGKRIHLLDEKKISSACRTSEAVFVELDGEVEATRFTGADEELDQIFAGIRNGMKHASNIHVVVNKEKK